MRRRRRVRRWLAALVPALALGCAPLDSWNPPVAAAYGYGDHYPCTYAYPYFHGYDEAGKPRCTVRPYDPDNADIDALDLP